MSAITQTEQAAFALARQKYIGGEQSSRVAGLNEGVIRHLYSQGMTQSEIAASIGTSQRTVHLFMRRCGIEARVAAKRQQCGPMNANWKGDAVKYKPAHNRVYAARGRPSHCEHCGKSGEGRYEWANLSGRYHDTSDYIRLCRSCHCKYDNLIRNLGAHAKEARNANR